MDPITLALAGAGAVRGVTNLIGGGKARRANRKARKEELRMLRMGLQSFDEQAPSQRVQLGEAQQGMEGGVADERVANHNTELARQRERILVAIKQAKRAKKAAGRQERLSVLGDIAGVAGNAAAGLSQLFAAPAMPMGQQIGSQIGAGAGSIGMNPLAAIQGGLQGLDFAKRRQQMGMLQRGY